MSSKLSKAQWAVIAALISVPTAQAQSQGPAIRFEDVTSSVSLGSFTNTVHGGGVSIEDIDGDGDLDMFLAQSVGNPPSLYLYNSATGRYQERATQWGLDSIPAGRVTAIFDYNADGLLDILVGTEEVTASSAFYLYEQQSNSTFTDVTAAADLLIPPTGFNRAPFAVGDINNDGYLDFWSGMWDRDGTAQGSLFLNDGDGTFSDITASSGVLVGTPNTQWQAAFYDFDGDGFQDLYINIDFEPNKLFMNQGDNTFIDEAAAAGVDNSMNDMGLALADYDNDGDIDMYITNIKNTNEHNVLYRNDSVGGALAFTDVAETLGVDSGGWGWGCAFFDADMDGNLDIIAGNGFATTPNDVDPTIFHRNRGNGASFSPDRAAAYNVRDRDWTVGIIPFDYDNDGDVDLARTTNIAGVVALHENQRLIDNDRHFLNIRPRMDGNNQFAIGATITCTSGAKTQTQYMGCGTSYQSQAPAIGYFGLGNNTQATITVNYPDGRTTTLNDISCDRLMEVAPPPLTDMVLEAGSLVNGNVLSIRDSDNERLRVEGRALTVVDVGLSTDVVSPTTLTIDVECGCDVSGINGELWVKNWNTGLFDSAASFVFSTNDTVQSASGLAAADYIDSNGRVEVQVRGTTSQNATREQEYRMLVDQVSITVN